MPALTNSFVFGGGGGGGGGAVISLPPLISVDASFPGPDAVSSTLSFDNDGQFVASNDPGASINWQTPDGTDVGDGYEIRLTLTSGTMTAGTTGSWLTFPQAWTKTRSLPGFSEVEGTLEIRLASTGEVLATGLVTMSAEMT